MTKCELMKRYGELLEEKRIAEIDGIYNNSTKPDIQNAIDCLECPDDMLNDYLTVIKLKYPNIHRMVTSNGDYRYHPHNRLYVYNTARAVLI